MKPSCLLAIVSLNVQRNIIFSTAFLLQQSNELLLLFQVFFQWPMQDPTQTDPSSSSALQKLTGRFSALQINLVH